MYDLSVNENKHTVSPDLPEYIMENNLVRVALRQATRKNISNDQWQQVIDIFNDEDE